MGSAIWTSLCAVSTATGSRPSRVRSTSSRWRYPVGGQRRPFFIILVLILVAVSWCISTCISDS